MSMFLVVLA